MRYSLILEPTAESVNGVQVWRCFAILPTTTIGPEDILIRDIALIDGGQLATALGEYFTPTGEKMIGRKEEVK